MTEAYADYRFLMIDVGAYDKDSDGSIWVIQIFIHNENCSLKLLNETKLSNSNISTPLSRRWNLFIEKLFSELVSKKLLSRRNEKTYYV